MKQAKDLTDIPHIVGEREIFRIAKTFHFCASHIQTSLPNGHKCARLHGHNYKLIVFLESDAVDKSGFVLDVGELQELKNYIDETLDHRHLNDVLDFAPSAELLAKHLFYIARKISPQVSKVQLWETDGIFAEFEVETLWSRS